MDVFFAIFGVIVAVAILARFAPGCLCILAIMAVIGLFILHC